MVGKSGIVIVSVEFAVGPEGLMGDVPKSMLDCSGLTSPHCPVPASCTVWVPALSVTISVPEAAPLPDDGVNVTLIVQLPSDASVAGERGQLSVVPKSPPETIDVMPSVALPLLVRMTDLDVE